MTDVTSMSREKWDAHANCVQDRFDKIFGHEKHISVIYHENDYADNSIDIDGVLEIGEVEEDVSTINGTEKKRFWQLYKVAYYPGSYHNPPDCDVTEVGVPHRRLDDCIREAVKLYAEYSFDSYMEILADEEQEFYEECGADGPHSWKP